MIEQTNLSGGTPQAEPDKSGLFARLKGAFSAKFPDDMDKKAYTREVFSIAAPAMAESFLLHLASMADTMMVGTLGTWAIASVGYCNQPRLLVLAVFQAFNTGTTALIARAKGAGEHEKANRIMHQCILMAVLAGALLAGVGIAFAREMVMFMGADTAQTIEGATAYLRIIFYGLPMNVVSMAVTASLRGIGKTRASMLYNVAANVINIICNYLFINGNLGMPALGIRGAALGMSVGYTVAMAMALITVVRGSEMLHFRLRSLFRWNASLMRSVTKIGFPAMCEQFCMRFGNIIFNKIIASLGTDAFACHQILNNMWQMTMTNGTAFGIAATSLLGQSLGRKRPDQGKAAVQLCRRYAFIMAVALGVLIVLFGKPLMGLYTDEQPVIDMGARVLIMVALLQPVQSSQQVVAGALRGAGDTKAVAICIFVGICVMRPILTYISVLVLHWELMGVWLSLLCDQTMRAVYTIFRFASDKWKYIRI